MTQICIILLLNLLFFFKTITYKYVSDDIPSANRPKSKNKWKHLFHVIEGSERSYPQLDHFITTVIHALVAAGVYLGFGADNISFIAALLFSFNPINNQGSVWISGRGYAMSALWMVWTLSIPVLGPLFLLCATYYNAGFLTPIALIGSNHSWLLFFMPLIWAYHYKRFQGNVKQKMSGEMFDEDKKVQARRIIIALKTFGFYIVHALIPVKTTFYHSYLQSLAGSGATRGFSKKDRFLWIGITASLAIWIYWTWVPWNRISFGLLWWVIGILPFINIVRCQQEISERYVYLPLPGLMVVLSSVFYNYPLILAAILGMYATKLWFYMDAYQDDYYICEHATLNSPDSWFAWHVRAMKRWDTQSYQEAAILWTMAKLISPNEFKILFNLATVLRLGKHEAEALKYIEHAEKVIPKGQEQMAGAIIKDWKEGKLSVVL